MKKGKNDTLSRLLQTVEKVGFQQDIALNQLPSAHKSVAGLGSRLGQRWTIATGNHRPVTAMSQYLAENGVKSAKNFIAAPPW